MFDSFITDRVPHVRRGIQEKSRTDLDYETGRKVAGKGNFPFQEAEGHCRLEKGLYRFKPLCLHYIYFAFVEIEIFGLCLI